MPTSNNRGMYGNLPDLIPRCFDLARNQCIKYCGQRPLRGLAKRFVILPAAGFRYPYLRGEAFRKIALQY